MKQFVIKLTHEDAAEIEKQAARVEVSPEDFIARAALWAANKLSREPATVRWPPMIPADVAEQIDRMRKQP